ncbi:MAG TPA: M50 family metallopeptidase [Gemmataceae bacterium]|jgi:Zn-dependent protease|nr:M50 family metallopeptidase [Gemmataceae bacterium]
MLKSWKIGRAFGIDIYIHWSFVFLFFLALWVYSPHGAAPVVFTLLLVPALLGSVLLHEYGHALTARIFGISTRDITLYPIGGVARLERMSEVPFEEIIISLAGPAVNVVIFAILLIALAGTGNTTNFPEGLHAPSSFAEYFEITMLVNLGLLLFNMIPAFPMDGGRVFRAFLALFLPRITATKIALGVGMPFAALFVLGAIAGKNPILLLIAAFIPLAGFMELAMLQRQAEIRRRAMFAGSSSIPWVQPADGAPSADPPEPRFSGYTWDSQARAWVEWRDGLPIRFCRMSGL